MEIEQFLNNENKCLHFLKKKHIAFSLKIDGFTHAYRPLHYAYRSLHYAYRPRHHAVLGIFPSLLRTIKVRKNKKFEISFVHFFKVSNKNILGRSLHFRERIHCR